MSNEQLLSEIVKKTNSEIILFCVVAALIIVMGIIPLYAMVLKERKAHRRAEVERIAAETEAKSVRHDKYMEREKQIIAVITGNTEVMSGLKNIIERDGKATAAALERVHARIDLQSKTLIEQGSIAIKTQSALDELVRKQRDLSDFK